MASLYSHLRLSSGLLVSLLAQGLEPVSQMSQHFTSSEHMHRRGVTATSPAAGVVEKWRGWAKRMNAEPRQVGLKPAEESHIHRIIPVCILEGKELVLVMKQTFLFAAMLSLLTFSPSDCFNTALYRLFPKLQD